MLLDIDKLTHIYFFFISKCSTFLKIEIIQIKAVFSIGKIEYFRKRIGKQVRRNIYHRLKV